MGAGVVAACVQSCWLFPMTLIPCENKVYGTSHFTSSSNKLQFFGVTIFPLAVVRSSLPSGSLSRVCVCCGGTRSVWTMQSGELGSFSVSTRHGSVTPLSSSLFHTFPHHIFLWEHQDDVCEKISHKKIDTMAVAHWLEWNSILCTNEMLSKMSGPALFRCGEEEEPSVRVYHATGWLRGWFTSKAWGDLIVLSNMFLDESSCCCEPLVELNRN